VVLAVALAASVVAVHDVAYILGHPFWFDESWVADSIRAPLHALPLVTGSSPIGWTALLRLVPGAGDSQRARLIPLAFCALACVAAYLLGHELRLSRYFTGLLMGTAVLLSPAMLGQNELKQYSAAAFASVMVLALAARLENEWSRRRLLTLVLFVVVGFLFAATVVFVAVAVFVGLSVEVALRRDIRRALELAAAGIGGAVLCGVFYLLTVKPNVVPGLKAAWVEFYLPRDQGLSGLMHALHVRAEEMAPLTGFANLRLLTVLVLAATVLLAIDGRWAIALALPVTIVINIAASLMRAYPFGNARLSAYWLVLVPMVIAVIPAYLIRWVARRGSGWNWAAGLATVGACLLIWVPLTARHANAKNIPDEGVGYQVAYLTAHFRPGDVVIVNEMASFGFAFYDHHAHPHYTRQWTLASGLAGGAQNGFLPVYPQDPWVIQMTMQVPDAVQSALSQATSEIAAGPDGPVGRIWIVRTDVSPAEGQAWSQDLAGQDVRMEGKGRQPVLLVVPPGQGAGG
jgi:hypothetical protein